MAKKIYNIHDKFVRESFSDPSRAIAFFEKFLPSDVLEYLDIDSLKVQKESYMNEALKEHFSDLVFEVSMKNDAQTKADVVLLFEHKSTPDKHVLIQLGYYLFAHWSKVLAAKQKIKVIIPIIYYQGMKEWEKPEITAIFDNYPEVIKNYLPKFIVKIN
ncbi:MAG: Rpn family recombination-promoting nuclease/putative transposase [Saprospiraceae bacterium]